MGLLAGFVHDSYFVRRQAVEAKDDLVYQIVRKGERSSQWHDLSLGALETCADCFLVGFFEAEFVGAEMGEDIGGFKFPKLVELGLGLQSVCVNAVKIFEVGQELSGGGALLTVEGRYLFGQEGNLGKGWSSPARRSRPFAQPSGSLWVL